MNYPELDPVALNLGPVTIHWYGVTYIVGLGMCWWLATLRAKRRQSWSRETISDLLFYAAIGVVLGGRIGYVLFYGFASWIEDPVSLLRIWQGGMSFHGGMLGVFLALYFFSRKHKKSYFEVADFVAPLAPLGLGMGRIGNFINAELPGRVTDVPWALVYPGELVTRHPSSLYQFCLEGPVLFCWLWWFSARPRPRMAVSGMFMIGYGTLRLISEQFRQPDPHLNFIAFDWLTMGQLLSLPMVILGIYVVWFAYRANTGTAKTGFG